MVNKTHKYGINFPVTNDHDKIIQKNNGNMYQQYDIKKDICNASTAFTILEQTQTLPQVNYKVSVNLIFDVNIDFKSKSRWVKDEQHTPEIKTLQL